MTRTRFLFLLDAVLLLALAFLQEPRVTSIAAHEWAGAAFAAVVAIHLLVNWRWIVNTLRKVTVPGSRGPRVNATINATLFVAMVLTVFSGFVTSEVVLPPLGLARSNLRAWGDLHSFLGSACLVIVGLHIALNWDWIVGVVRKRVVAGTAADPSAGE